MQLNLFALEMPKKEVTIENLPYQYAFDAVRNFKKDCRLIGLTKGQFSLVDLMVAVIDRIGDCDVILSTWSAGLRDAEVLRSLIETKRVTGFAMLVDRSFSSRHTNYAEAIERKFGKGAIRTTNTHAKFVLLKNKEYSVTIKTSMNLNHNPRFETFDIDECEQIYSFFKSHVDELFEMMPQGFTESRAIVNPAFDKTLKDTFTITDDREFQFPVKSFSFG